MVKLFSYSTTALLTALSGVLHLVAPVFAGTTQNAMMLLPLGALYLLAAFGLTKNQRWLAWLVFMMMLINTLFAFGYSFNGTTVPAWIYAGITVTNVLAMICLFAVLWRPKAVLA